MKKHTILMYWIRIILICLTFLLCYLFTFVLKFPSSAIFALLAVIMQINSLIKVLDKNNQRLKRFLIAIEYADFSQSFDNLGLGTSYEELSKAFSTVMERFRELRMEKEEQFHFLNTVVRQVETGLLSYREDGSVQLFNNAAKKNLGLPRLKNIENLNEISPDLYQKLIKLKNKDQTLVKFTRDQELQCLSLNSTVLKQKGEIITLVSIQNIQSELEEKEIESWQKLIRVLTHEIMNSITPISSLSSTADNLLSKQCKCEDNPESLENYNDIKDALQTIQKRSEGLVHFVNSYKSMTKIPKPVFKVFSVKELFDRIKPLLLEKIQAENIKFISPIKNQNLEIMGDINLIEQVLINLLINSIQALSECKNKTINLNTFTDNRNRILIQVTDNGPGIEEEALDKIFIPFFTTKKTGSGIGLSFSRQIMRLHKGTIFATSIKNQSTTFTLRF